MHLNFLKLPVDITYSLVWCVCMSKEEADLSLRVIPSNILEAMSLKILYILFIIIISRHSSRGGLLVVVRRQPLRDGAHLLSLVLGIGLCPWLRWSHLTCPELNK